MNDDVSFLSNCLKSRFWPFYKSIYKFIANLFTFTKKWKNKIKVTSSRILIITGFIVTVLRHVFKLKLATVIDAILRMSFGTQHNSQTGSIIWSTQKEKPELNVFRYQFIRFPLYDIILETESLKWSTMEIGHKRFKILSKD